MIRRPISSTTQWILQILSIAVIVGGYSFMSWRQHQINPSDKTIPTISQFVDCWKTLIVQEPRNPIKLRKWLPNDLAASGTRLFLGLAGGVALSFFVGMGMGVHPPVEAFFRWPIKVLGSIPPTAMLAIYFVIFGIGLNMYVAMIALGIFPALSLSIYRACITDVSDHSIYKAYTLGADSFEVIMDVVFQQILPRIIEFVRIAVGPALIFLIAAEWSNADVGFGYQLKIQSRLSNMNVVYTYLAILALFSFGIDSLLFNLRRYCCPWFGKE